MGPLQDHTPVACPSNPTTHTNMSYANALKTVDFLLEVLAEADKAAPQTEQKTESKTQDGPCYTSVEDDGIEEGKTVKVTSDIKILNEAWIEAELGENDDKGMYLGAIGKIIEIEEDDDTVKIRYANYDTMWMPIKACVSSNGQAETLPKGMISHLDKE